MSSTRSDPQDVESAMSSSQRGKRLLPSPFPNSASSTTRDTQSSYSVSRPYTDPDQYVPSAEDLMGGPSHEEEGEVFLGSSDEQDGARPAFHPLFTVIQDVGTNGTSHHHPHVHYIFSDDDPDPVTNALLDAVDPNSNAASADGPQERVIIVDIAADGQTVAGAKSLSPDWQLTSTQVQTAPTFDDAEATNETGLMLSIAGTARPPGSGETSNAKDVLTNAETAAEGDMIAAMESLAEQYAQEMGLLKKWSYLETTQD